jgi:hypothetical protein
MSAENRLFSPTTGVDTDALMQEAHVIRAQSLREMFAGLVAEIKRLAAQVRPGRPHLPHAA